MNAEDRTNLVFSATLSASCLFILIFGCFIFYIAEDYFVGGFFICYAIFAGPRHSTILFKTLGKIR